MELHDLLLELQATGCSIEAVGDKVRCRSKAGVPPVLAGLIHANRNELLRFLAADEAALAAGEIGEHGEKERAWVEIAGRKFSPGAAWMHRNSVPFSVLRDECRCCGGERHWRLHDGCPWVCAVCHPSDRASTGLEWKGAEVPANPFELNLPPDHSTPVDAHSQEADRG